MNEHLQKMGPAQANVNSVEIETLLQRVKTVPEKADAPAPWARAREAGSGAIKPLCELLADGNPEVRRNATRALYDIVRHAGRPEAQAEAKGVRDALVTCLGPSSSETRRQIAWMLSEIGDGSVVPAVAELLNDPNTREDARCVLIRLPGKESVAALESAFKRTSDDEFKYALADALRARGVNVRGFPSRKTQPVRATSTTPIQKQTPSR